MIRPLEYSCFFTLRLPLETVEHPLAECGLSGNRKLSICDVVLSAKTPAKTAEEKSPKPGAKSNNRVMLLQIGRKDLRYIRYRILFFWSGKLPIKHFVCLSEGPTD